jgi:N-acyl-phosphatidylethanolamine-hydrolysing phospholipase D
LTFNLPRVSGLNHNGEDYSLQIRTLARHTTEHHNGRKFRNIWGAHVDSDSEKFDHASGDLRHRPLDIAGWILRKGIANKSGGIPAAVRPLNIEALESPGAPRITWLGHAACLVQADGLNILTDPVFGERVSPVKFAGPKRLCGLALPVEELPRIDAIVLSHNHYDHAEADTLRFLAGRENPPVFLPLRVASLGRALGFRSVYELDWWQQIEMGKLCITCLPAKHFSGRSATDRNETLWASFMISFMSSAKHVYFAGDTAYSQHFSDIATEFPSIDATLMPIGAYLPRWFMREVHVSPDEAIQAFADLNAGKMLGIHWGTYDLADEQWDQPKREAIAEAARIGIAPDRIKIVDVGESFAF